MLYTAKCYWPGVSRSDVERVANRALRGGPERSRDPGDTAYLGSLLFPDDDLVLCLFQAASRTAVKQETARAGIPCERVMQATWLAAELGSLLGEG